MFGDFFYSILIAYKNNIVRNVLWMKIQVIYTAIGVENQFGGCDHFFELSVVGCWLSVMS